MLFPAVNTNRSPPAERTTQEVPSNAHTNGSAAPAGGLDFNAELTKHLTMKRQKSHVAPTIPPVADSSAIRPNRGPPPQPPPPKPQSPPELPRSSPSAMPFHTESSLHKKPNR